MKILISILFLTAICNAAYCDVIYFKDGGRVEGIIKEEEDGRIVVDLGIGTMTVSSDEIERVEEASDDEVKMLKTKKLSHEIAIGDWAPEGFGGLKTLYRAARSSRRRLAGARRKLELAENLIEAKEDELSALMDELDAKGKELKTVDSKEDVERYNNIVADMNSLNAMIKKVNRSLEESREDARAEKSKVSGLIDSYRKDFTRFAETFEKKKLSCGKENGEKEALYLDVLETEAAAMEKDFLSKVAEYEARGNQIIVEAILNGFARARLVVDTGATITLLTGPIAERLGMPYGQEGKAAYEILLADGSKTLAQPVILESVRVGEAEVKGVEAAVIDTDSIGGTDGLLGMSFLNNFVIRLDNQTSKLILERVL